MSNKPEKKQTGKVNYVWVLAGGYLVYLSVQIFKELLGGRSSQPVFGTIGGVAFLLVGLWLMLREWRAYRYGAEHIDDPSTWNDDEEELAVLKETEEIGDADETEDAEEDA